MAESEREIMQHERDLNTEFGVDRSGDRGNPPVPGGNVSSSTFRVPEGTMMAETRDGARARGSGSESHASTGKASDAHTDTGSETHAKTGAGQQGSGGQGYNADASAPTPESAAAGDQGPGGPDRAASGQEEGKTHDL
jgi:hypothetical protein